MGGTHTCSVSLVVTVGGVTSPPVIVLGTAVNGVINNLTFTVPLVGTFNLSGIPCPTNGSITVSIPAIGTGAAITLVITAVD
ncbi:hypothetical protein [Priestia megaterium]|uniref:hypothetical protein n=1 Tax=Priestia megaterium TaxID=1404 RepID=UPI00263A493C|nr:hypothetical protein [Priestia megaterium]MDN4866199.1 hypothetical protein [Priestia megaterium]